MKAVRETLKNRTPIALWRGEQTKWKRWKIRRTSSVNIFLKIMAQVVEVGESLGLEHREEVMLSKPEDEEVHKNK